MEDEKLQKETKAMIALLKVLEKEEHELILQNQILAREALLNGYSPNLEPTAATSTRRKSSTKKTDGGNK